MSNFWSNNMAELRHDAVYQFLFNLDLDGYWQSFQDRGYDREDDLVYLTSEDMDHLNIQGKDREILLDAVKKYEVSEDLELVVWLQECGLEYYHDNFRRAEYNSLDSVAKVDLNDTNAVTNFYTDIEMDMPGHRQRLKRAIQQLQTDPISGKVAKVTMGYWGKPACLKDSKFEFLCIKAKIESTNTHKKQSEELEFIVDSGSEVATLREDILKNLDLNFIGICVNSVGIHAPEQKSIYSGRLRIGDRSLDVDVMPGKVNSVGNQILRSFQHEIGYKKHKWLWRSPPPEVPNRDEGQHDQVVPEVNTPETSDGDTDNDDIEMDDATETNDVVQLESDESAETEFVGIGSDNIEQNDNQAIHGAQSEVSESMEINQNDPME